MTAVRFRAWQQTDAPEIAPILSDSEVLKWSHIAELGADRWIADRRLSQACDRWLSARATRIGSWAAAQRFIDEGAFVFIFGRRQEALDAAVAAFLASPDSSFMTASEVAVDGA